LSTFDQYYHIQVYPNIQDNANGIIFTMPSIVALDLETTGLNPNTDAIIEIGAVKFNDRRIEDQLSVLINPGFLIPPAITQLTGISNEMVRNSPKFIDVFPDLLAFIGNLPILGHNVGFDLAFLKADRYFPHNEIIDTFDIGAVLYPTVSRYNLSGLAQNLDIIVMNAHRALDDAQTTRSLYNVFYEKGMSLPISLVAEFTRLSESFNWGANYFFRTILKNRTKTIIPPEKSDFPFYLNNFLPEKVSTGLPIKPNETLSPLDPDIVASYLDYGGLFSKHFDTYENRAQQIEMAKSVARAFSEGYHLLIEAGTGTGKSYAYLLPAVLWAVNNNRRVVISTNTINLQDQLIKKDIPDLKSAMGLDIQAAVLKGRANYLCPRRLENLRNRGPENAEEMRVLAKLLVWLHENGKGDRNEITLTGPAERDIWTRLSADDETCKSETCLSRMGGACPFFQANQSAQTAHIIVVNHALLLADIATGSRILPEYDYLVIDEAHHLESATTNALSNRITQSDLQRLFRELGGTSGGVLGHLTSLVKSSLKPSDFALLHKNIESLDDISFQLENNIRQFFQSIDEFLVFAREDQPIPGYGQQLRVLPATRTTPNWEPVEISWELAGEKFTAFIAQLSRIYSSVSTAQILMSEDLEDTLSNLSSLSRNFSEVYDSMNALVSKPDPDFIYWLEISPNRNQIILQIAPLQIGPMMEKYLWHEKSSIILTSATLTTNEGFDYMRGRLNADEADEIVLGSPFDYQNSALLFIANDIPEPNNAAAYQRTVESSIIKLARATNGRLLALFTSYAQLKRTSLAIAPALAEQGIIVYEQGEGASPNTLLENFKSADKAVLLGTRSFWEGIDIPGEALSALVIVKLPFDVPSDPIIAARSETYDNPFNEFHLPEAILKFRQGFGRLIRTQSDRGIVVLLDRRVLTKQYGKFFLDSLPDCTIKVAPLQELPSAAKAWLNY